MFLFTGRGSGPAAGRLLHHPAPTPHTQSTHTHTHTHARTHTHTHLASGWQGPVLEALPAPVWVSSAWGCKQTGWGAGRGVWGEVLDPSRRSWSEASSSWGRDTAPPGLKGGVVVEMGCFNPFLPSCRLSPQPALRTPAGGMGRVGKSSKEEAEVFEKHSLKTQVHGKRRQLSVRHRQSSLPWST